MDADGGQPEIWVSVFNGLLGDVVVAGEVGLRDVAVGAKEVDVIVVVFDAVWPRDVPIVVIA